jgi:hypothetical protein
MIRMKIYLPVLAMAICSVAVAEPRGGLFRNASLSVADETAAPVSLVGFFYRGGGGYGPSCGCDMAAPSCGIDAGCAGSCGGDYWGGYCGDSGCRHHHLGGLFHHHRRGCCNMDVSCGCGAAAPSCGIEPSCGAAPSCGCDMAPACGCGRHSHFGHHLMCGGGCGYGCGCRCVGHRHRFWANGWCGQIGDGYCGGSPVDCSGGGMGAPGKVAPMPEVAPPMPMDDVPAKSTRRPLLSPRFSARPIGLQ